MMPAAHVRLSAGRESNERRAAGAVLHGWRELDVLRRKAADHGQPGRGTRPGACSARLGLKAEVAKASDTAHECSPEHAPHGVTQVKREVSALKAAFVRGRSPASAATAANGRTFPVEENRAQVVVEGQRLVDFCSNDYSVSLATRRSSRRCAIPPFARASAAALRIWSRPRPRARDARRKKSPPSRAASVHCSSPPVIWQTLPSSARSRIAAKSVLLDRLDHASLIDGALLSGARFSRYAHGDGAAAERALIEHKDEVSVLATDGVFSMDGDIARLPSIARACLKKRPGSSSTTRTALACSARGPRHARALRDGLRGSAGARRHARQSARHLWRLRRGSNELIDCSSRSAHLHLHDCASATDRRRNAHGAEARR